MIFCDDVSWQYGKEHDMTDVASKKLEEAILYILENSSDKGQMASPAEICRRLGREAGQRHVQFRLINKHHLENAHSEKAKRSQGHSMFMGIYPSLYQLLRLRKQKIWKILHILRCL